MPNRSPFSAYRSIPTRPASLLLVLLAATLGLSSCSDSQGNAASPPEAVAIPVRTVAVQTSSEQAWLRFAGVARSRQRAALTFQVGGQIRQRFVDIGQHVDAGQVLMDLYNPNLEPAAEAVKHRLAQLEAEHVQAQNELIRLETLYQRGVIPRQELEQQQARVDALAASVDNAAASLVQANQLLAETRLQAPFSGTVEAILLEPGEYAQPGQPVLRIASDARMETEIRIPGHLTRNLEAGQQLPVWFSLSPAQPFEGNVIEIGQSNTSGSALYPVVLALENNNVRAGEALEVGVPQRNDAALVAPLATIMRSADGLTVFRVSNNHVQRVQVEVEQLQGELAVLKPGNITEGDQLVYAGLTRLADGDRVEVLR